MTPPEDESQDSWKDIVRNEVYWLLHTLGIISLSLAIGRILTLLTKAGGIDLKVLGGDWQQRVEQSLRERNQNDDDTDDNNETNG